MSRSSYGLVPPTVSPVLSRSSSAGSGYLSDSNRDTRLNFDAVKSVFHHSRKASPKSRAARTMGKVTFYTCAIFAIFCLGRGSSEQRMPTVSSLRQRPSASLASSTNFTNRCDPYQERGVLVVDPSRDAGNYWQPFSTGCVAIDYMSLFHAENAHPDLEFIRGRTVVLLGDSIDRGNLIEFCFFARGQLQTIGAQHPLSPPYPPGREKPFGYHDRLGQDGDGWANDEQSRPHECFLPQYDFRILSFFHFGLQPEEDDMIVRRSHYYPPNAVEDRIDSIVVPILNSFAALPGPKMNAVPDLFSMTPGFWGILRQISAQDTTRDRLSKGGTQDKDLHHLSASSTMSKERQATISLRMVEVLEHIATAFPAVVENGISWKTTILWRVLNHIRYQHSVPANHVHAHDAIGMHVVERLIVEGRSTSPDVRGRLRKFIASVKLGQHRPHMQKVTATYKNTVEIDLELEKRLMLDPWGTLLLGQEEFTVDGMHPLPLPAAYLYGNMLLDKLRRVVEARAEGRVAS